jgi:acyl transferase domain-containing protein/acyl carrier protein
MGGKKEEPETLDQGVLLLERVWEEAEVESEDRQQVGAELVVLLCGMEKGKEELQAELLGVSCQVVGEEGKTEGLEQDYAARARRTLALVQEQMRQRGSGPVLLQLVASGEGSDGVSVGLWGLMKTAQLENPRLVPQVVLVEGTERVGKLAAQLRENQRWGEAGVVRYQSGRREVARWKEIAGKSGESDEAGQGRQGGVFRAGGVYLITGGGGGLGLLFAEEVAKQAAGARIVLIGRSELKAEAARKLEEIRAEGAEVKYWQVDVCDRKAVEEMVGQVHRSWGGIQGVIHSAGVIQDGFLLEKQVEELEAVLGPKVNGLVNLDQVLKGEKLEFFVMFSSGTGSWGNVGQGDYAAANGFMDAYARYRAGKVGAGERWGKTVSIGWPLWQNGGMKREARLVQQMREKLGTEPLASDSGLEAFFEVMSSGRTHVVVVNGDRKRLRQTFLSKKQQQQPTVRPSAPEPAVMVTTVATTSDINAQAGRYFKNLLASALKVAPEFIESDEPFADYGLDSIMVMEIIHELEKVFGALSKTLLFEYSTIDALVQYFLETYTTALRKVLGIEEQATRPVLSKPEQKQSPRLPQMPDQNEPKQPIVRFRSRSVAGSNAASLHFDTEPHQSVEETPHLQEVRSPDSSLKNGKRDIAIIGMSGRYPQARNLAEFWENLKSGKDCITEIPSARWDYHLYFDPEKGKPGKSHSKWGGFIDGVDEFDPLFFNISPREAELMDPQGRLFLQCAYESLEDAGYTRESLRRYRGCGLEGNVGVFVGVFYHEYQLYGAQAQAVGEPIALSGSAGSIANRVSHFCNFHGPSMSVDTMCSSSLTAIHLAWQSLQRNECELALAGGVNLALHPNKYLLLSQGQYVSSQGRCESFGEGGDGYVPGEGVGAVLLKPLDRAIADHDRIYAVIKASAVNHGGRTNGYTVPNPNAQANVITQAIRESGLPACAVSYIEAHGTGTKLGDPIEVAGLSKSFAPAGADQPLCPIGSVKSNIGHAESAAGVAGLTKVLLQIKHRMLAPSLHAEMLNPNIDFASTPFVVQRELKEWTRPVVTIEGEPHQFPLTAGISSFGAGGANCHVIVQEYDAEGEAANHAGDMSEGGVIVVLSARTREQLKVQAENLLRASLILSDSDLPAIGYTLQIGREAMDCRLGILVNSLQDLRRRLEQFLSGGSDIPGFCIGQAADSRDTVMLFTGDEDLQQGIDSWIEKRKYLKLLDLWVKGLKFDWERLYTGTRPKRIGLPTYPFARERYWVPAKKTVLPVAPPESQLTEQPLPATRITAKPSAIPLKPLDQVPKSAPFQPHPPVVFSRSLGEDYPGSSLPKTSTSTRGLERELVESLAEVLYMESSDVDINKQFVDLGMDSVVGVEWVRVINRKYALSIAAIRLYDHPTVSELAQFLYQELQGRNGGKNGSSLSTVLQDVYEGKVSAGDASDLLRVLSPHR